MIRCVVIFLLGVFPVLFGSGQEKYRLISYNVENLYDTYNDSITDDDAFTSRGKNYWTQKRYTDKLQKLAYTIAETGEGELPAFVGLCEIENRKVLTDLTEKTKLSDGNYGIVHRDSPDRRGIDVAFLYRKEYFTPLNESFLTVNFPEQKDIFTRDILYTSGILAKKDTLHFFVCHFPSMSGGESASEWRRKRAAAVLKMHVDSILRINSYAGIVILGDLNGRINNPAQKEVLKVQDPAGKIDPLQLYNTGYHLLNKNEGSYKYRDEWQLIDHIIVSGSLLNGRHTFGVEKLLKIFKADFLLEEDRRYFGFKLYRTYLGPRYHGGYSDHLPVYMDIHVR